MVVGGGGVFVIVLVLASTSTSTSTSKMSRRSTNSWSSHVERIFTCNGGRVDEAVDI